MTTDISPDFPFESKFLEVNGSKMHYVDVGEGIHYLHEDNPHTSGREIAKWLEEI